MDNNDSGSDGHRQKPETIGIIAGNGLFPAMFAREAGRQGFRVVTAAFRGEGEAILPDLSHVFRWFYLGQFKKLIRFFKEEGVERAVMLGGIRKTRIFFDVRPDSLAIKLLAMMRSSHDDGILRLFADILLEHGIRIVHSTVLIPELLSPPGLWTKKRPLASHIKDIEVGWEVARRIGELDVGQCVVVGGGSVLAVEAIDGTDATIRRGGGLGRGDAVLVKLAKPGQDMRFDVPAVGPETIRVMHEAGLSVLALEAGKTIALDRETIISEADRLNICVLSVRNIEDLHAFCKEAK
ncbi:UDP-2,3-diacylglucosamine diphosphatase LpxI [Desulfococcaceae bacterium OttesenSCG-928-F15]|nr:UDP-2,3-diacylglucosamine diphosphatase LpxI [Desulfococcaceae bacterium OttesenSCG-928-F15]